MMDPESEVASGAYLEETGARLSEQYVAVYESRTGRWRAGSVMLAISALTLVSTSNPQATTVS